MSETLEKQASHQVLVDVRAAFRVIAYYLASPSEITDDLQIPLGLSNGEPFMVRADQAFEVIANTMQSQRQRIRALEAIVAQGGGKRTSSDPNWHVTSRKRYEHDEKGKLTEVVEEQPLTIQVVSRDGDGRIKLVETVEA